MFIEGFAMQNTCDPAGVEYLLVHYFLYTFDASGIYLFDVRSSQTWRVCMCIEKLR
jgi:hypothetical protein